jgi:hypothetical protein
MMKFELISAMGYGVGCTPHMASVSPEMYNEDTVYMLIAIMGMRRKIPAMCQAVYAELANRGSCGAGRIPDMATHFAA